MKSILIVDDETDLRSIMSSILKPLGFETFEAENGLEAMKVIERVAIDLVITDVRMPGGSGIDLLKEIRQKNPHHPIVIMISGFTDITVPQALDLGAAALYKKPFDLRELVSAVRHFLVR